MPPSAWPDDDRLQIRQGDEAEPQDQRGGVYALHRADVVREKRHEHGESPKHKRQDRQAEVANKMSEGRRHQRLDDGKGHQAFV